MEPINDLHICLDICVRLERLVASAEAIAELARLTPATRDRTANGMYAAVAHMRDTIAGVRELIGGSEEELAA